MACGRKIFCACVALVAARPLAADDPDSVRALLKDRVEQGKAAGLVAGVIDEHGPHVVGYGHVSDAASAMPDGDTVFEIGSVTKVFTSLVLADMIERGEVKPDDPVSKYLPPSVKMPSYHGKQVTLLSLSMQISGLPRLPANLKPADMDNPYADYSVEQLYSFLSGLTLYREIGEKYDYSNLGVGLLGHVLALRAGMSYEEMVRRRILEPLQMTSTSIALSESQTKRLATPHDAKLHAAHNWDIPTLAGAGALRSTANDMLKFLAANLELKSSPLAPAMRRMRTPRHATGTQGLEVAMGWHALTIYGPEMIWHNGETGGYHSFAGFVPAKKTGVVVLSNSVNNIDDLGRHILEEQYPLAK
jgi:serine-type D-Ala-D-Ala carboxypeptidase/endopeptidase